MVSHIAAKPTMYRDVTFRSRLEARWAVFFDVLSIPWDYERYTIYKGSDNYVPDFQIFGKNEMIVLLEVKPAAVTKEYFERLHKLIEGYEVHLAIAEGSFFRNDVKFWNCERALKEQPLDIEAFFAFGLVPPKVTRAARKIANEYRFDLKG